MIQNHFTVAKVMVNGHIAARPSTRSSRRKKALTRLGLPWKFEPRHLGCHQMKGRPSVIRKTKCCFDTWFFEISPKYRSQKARNIAIYRHISDNGRKILDSDYGTVERPVFAKRTQVSYEPKFVQITVWQLLRAGCGTDCRKPVWSIPIV
jgi:hypothetical protein